MEIFIKDIESDGLLHRESIDCDDVYPRENYLELRTYYPTRVVTQILPINPNWIYVIIGEDREVDNG